MSLWINNELYQCCSYVVMHSLYNDVRISSEGQEGRVSNSIPKHIVCTSNHLLLLHRIQTTYWHVSLTRVLFFSYQQHFHWYFGDLIQYDVIIRTRIVLVLILHWLNHTTIDIKNTIITLMFNGNHFSAKIIKSFRENLRGAHFLVLNILLYRCNLIKNNITMQTLLTVITFNVFHKSSKGLSCRQDKSACTK